MLTAGEMTC